MSKDSAQNRTLLAPIELKCVAVGDGEVGKTCMLMAYTCNLFPEEYKPTVFEEWVARIHFDGREYALRLCDTAGQEAYDRLRPLSYPETKVFLLCFSVTDVTSFHNAKEKWIAELRHYVPQAAVILVGTKMDKRSKSEASHQMGQAAVKEVKAVNQQSTNNQPTTNQKPTNNQSANMELPNSEVSPQMAWAAVREIKAVKYMECSALTREGLKSVFDEAVRIAVVGASSKKKARTLCRVL